MEQARRSPDPARFFSAKDYMNRLQTICCVAPLLLAGSGFSQQLPMARVAPVISIVGLPTGAGIQGSGIRGLGALNLGHVSWAQDPHNPGVVKKKNKNSFALTTRFGLRLDCSAADANRFATMSASVQQPDTRFSMQIDGVVLSQSPVIITRLACSSTSEVSLSVEIPFSAPAGVLSSNLNFQVTLQ